MAKIACLLVVVVLLHVALAEYNEEFLKLDASSFVKDETHANKILDCLVDGACTGPDKKIVEALVQSFNTQCKDCSPEVESKVRQIAKVFVVKHNDKWTKVVQKYDPKMEHVESFKKFLEKA